MDRERTLSMGVLRENKEMEHHELVSSTHAVAARSGDLFSPTESSVHPRDVDVSPIVRTHRFSTASENAGPASKRLKLKDTHSAVREEEDIEIYAGTSFKPQLQLSALHIDD